MSFEKKMQKRGNDKLNQFAKNPYHQEPVVTAPTPKVKRFPVWATVLIPSIAVACAIILVVPMMMSMGAPNGAMKANDSKHDESPTAQEGSTYPGGQGNYSYGDKEGSEAAGSEPRVVPHWEDQTNIQRYPEFTYLENKYTVNDLVSTQPIDVTYVNEKLADVTVEGFDELKNETHTINASLYSIKNIALDVSLAIKFADTEEYYSYQNNNVYFADIGELMDKLSFNTEVIFDQICIHDLDEQGNKQNTYYRNVNTKDVTNVLFTDRTVKNNKNNKPKLNTNDTSAGSSGGTSVPPSNPSEYSESMDILVKIPCLGLDRASANISQKEGKFAFTFASNYSSFYLGESNYFAAKEVIKTKGTVIVL